MKYTLLELIQRVLSSIKGEEVNSYSDTAESLVVRDIIKECYFSLISQQDFPEYYTFFELNASGDSTQPVLMTIPDDVLGIGWVKYNDTAVKYMTPTAFYERQVMLDEDDTATVAAMILTTGTSDDISFKYRIDKDPEFYTEVEDQYLLFDSVDLAEDTTLAKAKTTCYGLRMEAWADDDAFTPKLDPQQFMILLKDAKAMAFLELRQTSNAQAEGQGRRIKIKAEAKKHRANYAKSGYYAQLSHQGRK
jgi:hypothetical protein